MSDCRCGSGAHPRRCAVHPERYDLHCAEMSRDNAQDACDELEQQLATERAARERAEAERDEANRRVAELEEEVKGVARIASAARMERDGAMDLADGWLQDAIDAEKRAAAAESRLDRAVELLVAARPWISVHGGDEETRAHIRAVKARVDTFLAEVKKPG